MIPKSSDSYSRLSKELQVWSLALGAAATLIFLAMKLEAHVDLIEPGVHHIIQDEMSRRHGEYEGERWAQVDIYRYENEHQREHREFCEEQDREVRDWMRHRYDDPCGGCSGPSGPSGASYDHDKD